MRQTSGLIPPLLLLLLLICCLHCLLLTSWMKLANESPHLSCWPKMFHLVFLTRRPIDRPTWCTLNSQVAIFVWMPLLSRHQVRPKRDILPTQSKLIDGRERERRKKSFSVQNYWIETHYHFYNCLINISPQSLLCLVGGDCCCRYGRQKSTMKTCRMYIGYSSSNWSSESKNIKWKSKVKWVKWIELYESKANRSQKCSQKPISGRLLLSSRSSRLQQWTCLSRTDTPTLLPLLAHSKSVCHFEWLIHWLINWLINWFIHSFIDWLTDWLTDFGLKCWDLVAKFYYTKKENNCTHKRTQYGGWACN